MGIDYINLSSTSMEDLPDLLASLPTVILASIESLVNPEIQTAIRRSKISYIAIDECQVR